MHLYIHHVFATPQSFRPTEIKRATNLQMNSCICLVSSVSSSRARSKHCALFAKLSDRLANHCALEKSKFKRNVQDDDGSFLFHLVIQYEGQLSTNGIMLSGGFRRHTAQRPILERVSGPFKVWGIGLENSSSMVANQQEWAEVKQLQRPYP